MNRKYPWAKWLSRKRFALLKDRDFTCQPHSMAQTIRTRFAKDGVHVSIKIDGDEVTVTKQEAN